MASIDSKISINNFSYTINLFIPQLYGIQEVFIDIGLKIDGFHECNKLSQSH
jgi:hypothetical protein